MMDAETVNPGNVCVQEEEAVASVVVLRDGQEPVERPGDRPGGVAASSRIRSYDTVQYSTVQYRGRGGLQQDQVI